VKRVAQELGGKSANIILPSADIAGAVAQGVAAIMSNTGQSCDAPTRMFVPRASVAMAHRAAVAAVGAIVIGDTNDAAVTMGPLVSRAQFDKVQGLIAQGIAEGATLVCGGLGRPVGMRAGHYARPTIFGDVTPDMVIAREEIFGPVLVILPYDTVEDAVRMANDTVYGLAAYVQGDVVQARTNNRATGANMPAGASMIFAKSKRWWGLGHDALRLYWFGQFGGQLCGLFVARWPAGDGV
jgi:aldehyde dehydrogenase (NAD+)